MVVLLGSPHKNYPTRFSRKRLFTSQYNSRRTTLSAVTQFFTTLIDYFAELIFEVWMVFYIICFFVKGMCKVSSVSICTAYNVLEQFVGTNLKLLQVTLNEFLSTRVLECLTIWMVFNIYTVKLRVFYIHTFWQWCLHLSAEAHLGFLAQLFCLHLQV